MDQETQKILQFPRVQRTLQLIGMIATSWTQIELLWYLIYTCFLHQLPRQMADHIYKHFVTFAGAKPFVRHVAKQALADYPRLLEECDRLFQKTEDLHPRRNQAVHGVYWFDSLNGPPGLLISPSDDHTKQPNPLAKVDDLITELERTFNDIDTLMEQVDIFRLILVQEYLPDSQSIKPFTPEDLAAMPPEVRDSLPREKRERIAPPELRNPSRKC